MSFLSFDFAVFVGVALVVFHLAPARSRPALLLGLSYAFYLSWSVVNAVLLAAVTTGVYLTALWIERNRTEKGKRAGMAVGVMTLLVLLFAFKASAWIPKEFMAGGAGSTAAMFLIVPLGLSYYVFKMVGYLLDVYWELLPAERSFVSVALYGAFFPQIVSGPIQRAESFFGQIKKIKNPDAGEFVVGLRRILFGLFKKIVIADRLGVLVASVHANPANYSSLELLAGACCFAVQLYTDFSGITDIAIGVGLLFGVKGPENFDLPFLAANLQLFWRRWHMSLTTWLTDYLFTPLRMSLRNLGTTGLALAIFINMVAIGLWHGLSWNFLVFGIIQGVFMTVSVLTLKRRDSFFKTRPGMTSIRRVIGTLLTFNLVAFSLIFFRAESFASAIKYIAGLVPGGGADPVPFTRFNLSLLGISRWTLLSCLAAYALAEAVTWAIKQRACVERFFAIPVLVRRGGYVLFTALVLLMFKGTVTFIYARF